MPWVNMPAEDEPSSGLGKPEDSVDVEVSTEIRRLLLEVGQRGRTERPEGLDVDGDPLALPPLAPGSDYLSVDDDGGLNEPAASLYTFGEGRIDCEFLVAIVEEVRVEMAEQQGDAGIAASASGRDAATPPLLTMVGGLLKLLRHTSDRPPSLPTGSPDQMAKSSTPAGPCAVRYRRASSARPSSGPSFR
jgi:hypothetical protein